MSRVILFKNITTFCEILLKKCVKILTKAQKHHMKECTIGKSRTSPPFGLNTRHYDLFKE